MLSREAVQALINLADTAMDEEERYNLNKKWLFGVVVCFVLRNWHWSDKQHFTCSFIEMDDLKPYWRVPPILEKVVSVQLQIWGPFLESPENFSGPKSRS